MKILAGGGWGVLSCDLGCEVFSATLVFGTSHDRSVHSCQRCHPHSSTHVDYVIRILTGESGKDPTAFRRRLLFYAFSPMFRHNVKDYMVHQGLSSAEDVGNVLRAWPDKTQDIVDRLLDLYQKFLTVKVDDRAIDLSPEARLKFDNFLDGAGRAQQEFMYTKLYATSVLGKLPEMVLRSAVLGWVVAYVARAPDAILVQEQTKCTAVLSDRHFDLGVFLATSSLRVQAALLTPAPVPTRPASLAPRCASATPLSVREVGVADSTAATSSSGGDQQAAPAAQLSGLLLRGNVPEQTEPFPDLPAMLQNSHLSDREILRRTITAVSTSIKTTSVVPGRICNGWKKVDPVSKKDIRVGTLAWEAVMAHAESVGLGRLTNRGTLNRAF